VHFIVLDRVHPDSTTSNRLASPIQSIAVHDFRYFTLNYTHNHGATLLLLVLLEAERDTIDAMPLVRGVSEPLALEYVSQVTSAATCQRDDPSSSDA
jgi:hypothetical protein